MELPDRESIFMRIRAVFCRHTRLSLRAAVTPTLVDADVYCAKCGEYLGSFSVPVFGALTAKRGLN